MLFLLMLRDYFNLLIDSYRTDHAGTMTSRVPYPSPTVEVASHRRI